MTAAAVLGGKFFPFKVSMCPAMAFPANAKLGVPGPGGEVCECIKPIIIATKTPTVATAPAVVRHEERQPFLLALACFV
jgi:hypothetical protein